VVAPLLAFAEKQDRLALARLAAAVE